MALWQRCVGWWEATDFTRLALHGHPTLPSVRAVTPLARLLALGLAVFWLPLTMHCQLAGLKICCAVGSCCEEGSCSEDRSGCKDSSCCGDAPDCHSGVCKIVESGNYFLKKTATAVPVASYGLLVVSAPEACRGLMPPPVVTLSESTGAPPGWNRIWQFVFRAAQVPRAPSAEC